MIGLGFRLAQMRRSKPVVECERCGMHYPESQQQCPYCYGLEGAALQAVQEKVRMRKRCTADMGRIFLFIAVGVILAMGLFLLW